MASWKPIHTAPENKLLNVRRGAGPTFRARCVNGLWISPDYESWPDPTEWFDNTVKS